MLGARKSVLEPDTGFQTKCAFCSFFVLRACAFQHVDCRHYKIADCWIVEWDRDTIQHLLHLSIAMRDLMREGFYSKHSTCFYVRRLLTHTTSAVPWHHLRLREQQRWQPLEDGRWGRVVGRVGRRALVGGGHGWKRSSFTSSTKLLIIGPYWTICTRP